MVHNHSWRQFLAQLFLKFIKFRWVKIILLEPDHGLH